MQKRNVLNSPRLLELKRKRRNILIRNFIIVFIGFVLIVGALAYLSSIKRLNISEVVVEGNKIIDTEAVVKAVNNETTGKYFWLFPKTNIFLYPKSNLRSKLANEFKRFSNVGVEIQNKQTLKISVTERAPEYTWCGKTPTQTNEKETCYFLDKEGYVFDEAPYFSGEVYFKFYGNTEPSNENPAGSYVAKGYFDKLIAFKDTLVDMGLKPAVILIGESEEVKIYLSREKASVMGPEIILKKNSDFQKIAENLKAALDTEPFKSKFKNQYSALEYIDLRFGNKVYYKFK